MINRVVTTRKIKSKQDLVETRAELKRSADSIAMKKLRETELSTAATELIQNILRYAGEGEVAIEILEEPGAVGIRATFSDSGPGIADIEKAMSKGYSTGRSLGLGLAAAKTLVDDFVLESAPGQGTRVVIIKWC